MVQSFIQSMVLYCVVLMPVYLVARFVWMRKKQIRWGRELAMTAFFLYCVSIFSQTIIPHYEIVSGKVDFYFEHEYVNYNLIPFTTIQLYMEQLNGPLRTIAIYNLLGNILLFIPFGFFIPLLWRKMRSLFKMGIISACIPLFIEGSQYFIGRSVDVDDVLLNAIAIFLGYFCLKLVCRFTKILRYK